MCSQCGCAVCLTPDAGLVWFDQCSAGALVRLDLPGIEPGSPDLESGASPQCFRPIFIACSRRRKGEAPAGIEPDQRCCYHRGLPSASGATSSSRAGRGNLTKLTPSGSHLKDITTSPHEKAPRLRRRDPGRHRARLTPAYERAPDARPFSAIRSRYIKRFPTSPTVKAAICACVSAFRTLCFPANSLT